MKKEVRILTSPVGFTHLNERAAPVIWKIEGGEEGKEALGETRSGDIPVVRARIVEPGGTKDTGIHIIWKVVIVEASKPRRDRAKRREGMIEKPVCLRERKR